MDPEREGGGVEGGAGPQPLRGQEEESEEQGRAGQQAARAGAAYAGNLRCQTVEFMLSREGDHGQDQEGRLFRDGEEASDPDHESDDGPKSDGAERAVPHDAGGAPCTWLPVMPNLRSRPQ
jgi:hypothetical protein